MKSKKHILFPKYQKIAEQLREKIKLAGKRRSLTTIRVSALTGIDSQQFTRIEQGNSLVYVPGLDDKE